MSFGDKREKERQVRRLLNPADGVDFLSYRRSGLGYRKQSSFPQAVLPSVSGVALSSRWALGFCSRRRIFLAVGVRFVSPAWLLSVKGERPALTSASSSLVEGGGGVIRVSLPLFLFFSFRFDGSKCGGDSLPL